jgi:hypothetical protein
MEYILWVGISPQNRAKVGGFFRAKLPGKQATPQGPLEFEPQVGWIVSVVVNDPDALRLNGRILDVSRGPGGSAMDFCKI